MAVYPASAAFLLVWLLLSLRNADNGVPMVIAVLPFGMFAAVVAGGLSIILANLLAMLTVGVLMLRWFSLGVPHTRAVHVPVAGIYLTVFAFYAVFSAIVLVRVFQGSFLVFPMSVTTRGTPVSTFFLSTMVPLQPTNSNIAQSGYIVLSWGFFLAAVMVARRRGLELVEAGMVWAAGLNVILGALDLVGSDALLGLIRTADYALNNQHTVSGMPRIIGGFAEPAAFGAASAGFFGYFMMSYLIGRRTRDGALALANLVGALLSLSSTGILALATSVIVILLHLSVYMGHGISRVFGHVLVIAVAALAIAASLTVILTPSTDVVSKVLDRLIFTKASSMSGIERGAWARAGFDAFVKTWGLGAGAGSLRANGLVAVLLGTVGVPGTFAFLAFLWQCVGKPLVTADIEARRVFYSGRVCALTLLASMLVSATSPDPTLFLIAAAALAVSAREAGQAAAWSAPGAPVLPDRA